MFTHLSSGLPMNSEDISASDDNKKNNPARFIAREILNGLETLIQEAQANTRPLEVDPYRSRMFEFFVTADGAGLIKDDREVAAFEDLDEDSDEMDLSADSLCRLLARRWGLDMAAREAQALQTRLPADQLERMRLLWSVMRMWIEWSYAWRRWNEFHSPPSESAV
jgi:hypothetical protein